MAWEWSADKFFHKVGSAIGNFVDNFTGQTSKDINDKQMDNSLAQFEKQLAFNQNWNEKNYDMQKALNDLNQSNWEKSYAQTEKNNAQSQANFEKSFAQEQANWEKSFSQSQDQFAQNMALQKDIAYNGLGMRIADAERNGISKWAVAGDGASAGVVGCTSVGNIAPTSASFGSATGSTGLGANHAIGAPSYSNPGMIPVNVRLDLLKDILSMKQIQLQTESMRTDNATKEYMLNYAKSHALPIGSAPNVQSSLLGLFNTEENREKVADNLLKFLDTASKNVNNVNKASKSSAFEKKMNKPSGMTAEKAMEMARKANTNKVLSRGDRILNWFIDRKILDMKRR